jgi:hypothetical protein
MTKFAEIEAPLFEDHYGDSPMADLFKQVFFERYGYQPAELDNQQIADFLSEFIEYEV